MNAPDEEIDSWVRREGCNKRVVGRTDPFCLEADEDGDLGGVFGA